MTDLYNACLFRAKELLNSGEVARVIGWRKGEFSYDVSPAFFETEEQLKDFTYDYFCGANLSKYLVEISKKEGVTAVFLKPCDTYSFNELVKEHRVARDKIRVIAVECRGKVDYKKAEKAAGESVLAINETDDTKTLELVTESGRKTVERLSVLLDKCLACKGKQHVASDETIILKDPIETGSDRFAGVEALEKMSAAERYAFWRKELSRCIRCNACRNVCPACTCVKCVFDNPESGISAKANDTSFEEQLYHVIRAFHVAGRCTDCGECSRVCPQGIPLHLLNRKFIKDIDTKYGEFQAGEEAEGKTPLTSYTEGDVL